MINKEQHIGKIYSSKNYGSFIITDYDGCNRVTIRFLTTQYETVASLDNIRIGNVRDKLVPSVFGGVVGDEVIKLGEKYIKEYYLWRSMLRRCYDEKHIEKKNNYKGCTVSENFKSFKYFKEWCNKQIGFGQDGWHLDKSKFYCQNVIVYDIYFLWFIMVDGKTLPYLDFYTAEDAISVAEQYIVW